MNINSVQNIIELSDAQFEDILGAEVSICSLITQATSVTRFKRFSERYSSNEISSNYLEPTLRQMLEINPNDLSVLITLAWEHWFSGEDEKISKSQGNNPNNKWILYLEIALSSNIQDQIVVLQSLNQ